MSIPIGGDNAFHIRLYARYLKDPASVPADWAAYFEETRAGSAAPSASAPAVDDYLTAARRFGHLASPLDPLGRERGAAPQLDLLRDRVLARPDAPVSLSIGGQAPGTAAAAVALIDRAYRGGLGLETDHMQDQGQADWLCAAFEQAVLGGTERDMLGRALESVVLADTFESFMRVKFPGKKRFGSEGSEGSLIFLREIFRAVADSGGREIVMGGMHRGRLAVLAVALGKSPATLAAELTGRDLSEGAVFTGDVPYHLGLRARIETPTGNLGVSLLPHPSHLMVVAPVALGMSRAAGDALCLLMHTDAAFAGQGVTGELMQIGALAGYSAGGAIHLVVNNQIGFTTLPSEGRGSRYCTDIGKVTGAPVLHVNGDDILAVARAARLALAWRNRFGRDILVDLVCYRRFGHNELDEPRFTQPAMWEAIDRHPTLRARSVAGMQADHPDLIVAADRAAAEFSARLQDGFRQAAEFAPNYQPIQEDGWLRIEPATEADLLAPVATGLPLERLRRVGIASSTIPPLAEVNPKVRRFYEQRVASLGSGQDINFASAEALAFATLLDEGFSVRMSGQDVVRGTFTQRHLATHDTRDGGQEVPLAAAARGGARFEVINSPLSEYGVLSFEYGHSLFDPNRLTVWEAQFGDFLNGAQSIVDQYIVSAEAKWHLRSGLVVQLPHGLEGQGPDHSSARIERLLQLCAGGNVVIANPSTPANLFHLLRRQIHAPWRKPLFLIAPKSLLRAKAAVSSLADMAEGTGFQSVIAEDRTGLPVPERVVLCSGKIAYALEQARAEAGLTGAVAILRLEQIYPLDIAGLRRALVPLAGAELVWLQEEAANQGAWSFLESGFRARGIPLSPRRALYARPALPVTAGGSVERHEREQADLLASVLHL